MEAFPHSVPVEMKISAMCPLTSLYFNNALISSHSISSIQLQTPLISPRNEEPQKTNAFICPLRDVRERLQWVSPGTHFRAWEKVDSTRAGRRWWWWCVSVCVHMCVLGGRCGRGRILEKAGLNRDWHVAAPAGPVWGPAQPFERMHSHAPLHPSGVEPSQQGALHKDTGIAESRELLDWHPQTLLSP